MNMSRILFAERQSDTVYTWQDHTWRKLFPGQVVDSFSDEKREKAQEEEKKV